MVTGHGIRAGSGMMSQKILSDEAVKRSSLLKGNCLKQVVVDKVIQQVSKEIKNLSKFEELKAKIVFNDNH